jgi:hypothetical protein
MSSSLKLGLLSALVLALAGSLSAQIFKIDGGTSTLFNADGGTISIKAPNYDGSIGAGLFAGHFELGAVARTKMFGYTVTAGDDSVRFDLPTDIFGNTSYYSARGVGLSRQFENSGFYVLGGLTSLWEGSSFFQAANSQDPVGIVFYHRRLTDNLHFFSREIFSTKSSALQGLEWKPQKWITNSFTGGIGSGKPYFALASNVEWLRWTLKASYAYVSPDFRRITVPDILNSEPERENIEATYHFNRDTSITAAHRNLMQPLSLNSPFARASMDQLSGNFRLGQSYFGAGLYTSRFSGRDSWGSNLFVGRRFRNFLDVNGSYFVSTSTGSGTQSMFTGTVREIITPRFNLLQVASFANGQVSFAYGGEFVTNRFNARVDYQTQYLAFRTANPFQQTLSLNASVRVIGPLALNATSSVAPDGHTRYSFGGTTYLYRYNGLFPTLGGDHESYRFPKYMVRGIVKDQEGNPVSGAAVQIGSDLIFTDGEGQFLYRSRKHKQMSFKIVPGQFLTTGFFEVVQAPTAVSCGKENEVQDVIVIVRRLTPQEAKLSPLSAEYKQYEPKSPGHE